MKKALAIALLSMSTACSQPDKICECIQAGEELNEKSAAFFENDATGNAEELKQLRERKDMLCKEFERMGGPEMKKRMESCR